MNNLIDNKLKEYNDLFDSLKSYVIEIGVFSADSKRKDVVSVGLTNAELMFIHENGAPLNNIPSRPVLSMTIEYARGNLLDKTLSKISKGILNENWKKEQIELELNKMCKRMQNYARRLIYDNDGSLIANSPDTMKSKWRKNHKKGEKWSYPEGNHPLFDTGQLARSITCQLTKR